MYNWAQRGELYQDIYCIASVLTKCRLFLFCSHNSYFFFYKSCSKISIPSPAGYSSMMAENCRRPLRRRTIVLMYTGKYNCIHSEGILWKLHNDAIIFDCSSLLHARPFKHLRGIIQKWLNLCGIPVHLVSM